jgi:hypothetical protein
MPCFPFHPEDVSQQLPDSCDVNVSPDKRTIFLHNEGNLITAGSYVVSVPSTNPLTFSCSSLKTALEDTFAPPRSTYELSQPQARQRTHSTLTQTQRADGGSNSKHGAVGEDGRSNSDVAGGPEKKQGRVEKHDSMNMDNPSDDPWLSAVVGLAILLVNPSILGNTFFILSLSNGVIHLFLTFFPLSPSFPQVYEVPQVFCSPRSSS